MSGTTIIIGLIGSTLWIAGSWRSWQSDPRAKMSIPQIYRDARTRGARPLLPATRWETALFLVGISLLVLAAYRRCSGV